MKIYLIRHGEYENPDNLMPGRSEGFPLSEKGLKEAKAMADFLRDKNIKKIFSSPILRTKQTAEVIAGEISVPNVTYDIRLIEMDCGDFSNRPLDEFRNSGFYQDIMKSPDSVEDLENIFKRTADFLEEIRRNYNENVLVVTHVYSIRCALSLINKTELKDCMEYKPKMGQIWEINVKKGSWTINLAFA